MAQTQKPEGDAWHVWKREVKAGNEDRGMSRSVICKAGLGASGLPSWVTRLRGGSASFRL